MNTHLKPNTYDVPFSLRAAEVWHEARWVLIFWAIPLIATAAFVYAEGHVPPALIGFHVLVLAFLVFVAVMVTKRGHVRYTTNNVEVRFSDLRYFVPRRVFEEFLKSEVLDPFSPHEPQGDASRLLRGVAVLLKPGTFRAHDTKDYRIEALGVTYPESRTSYVSANRILDPGVAAYELKLHCCHALFPGRSEGEDIAWMKERGIV